MKIIDISWPLHNGMQEYKNRKSVKITQTHAIETGGARDFELCMNNHTGTHVDGPTHFLPTGKNLYELGLEKLIGKAQILDLTNCVEKITVEDLKKHTIVPHEIVLLKTRNSFREVTQHFDNEFVFLEAQAAEYLAFKQINALGIDYLGIERNQSDHATHKALLKCDILIIEGLRLNDVPAGSYMFCCLPLALTATDSAPARAILIQ